MTIPGARSKFFCLESAKAAETSPSGEKKPTVYKFRANDGEYDRYQDRLSVAGWKLDAFNALRGPILLNHEAGDGGFLGLGPKEVLSLGKARAYVENNALMVEVEFDPKDPLAQRVEQKIADGYMGAVSVRYRMHKYHENERGGYDSEEQELFEISVVTIPGNERALRVKGAFSDDENDFLDALAARVTDRKQLSQPPGATMDPEAIKQMQAENAALKAKAAELAKAEEAAKAVKAAEEMAAKVAEIATAKIMEQAKGNRDGALSIFADRQSGTPDVRVGKRVAAGTGIDLVRFLMAKAAVKMNGESGSPAQVVSMLQARGYQDSAKALSSGEFAGMGSLIKTEFASDFIELLRNETVVRKAGPRTVPLHGRLEFDGQATDASASYTGETTEIAKSNPTTSRPLVLTEKKLTGLSVIPNDLIRAVGPTAEAFVRDSLVRVMAIKEDLKFLYGQASGANSLEPLGITEQLVAGNIFAMTALATAGVPTVGELKKQFNKVLKVMKLANAGSKRLVWFMSPSIEAGIMNATGPGGEGTNIFEREMVEKGTIRGKPYFVTNQITETSSADLLCFDMDEVIIGESLNLEAEVFPNGTWSESGTAKSGISTDQSVVRMISKHDIGLRHNVAGVKVTGVTWGI